MTSILDGTVFTTLKTLEVHFRGQHLLRLFVDTQLLQTEFYDDLYDFLSEFKRGQSKRLPGKHCVVSDRDSRHQAAENNIVFHELQEEVQD